MAAIGSRCVIALALACGLIALPAGSARAAPGDLDIEFGGDGRVITDLTEGLDSARDVAIQSNGRVVVAGRASSKHFFGRFAVVRYKANGALDSSFGGDGTVITNFVRREDSANAVALQDDGKIVAAGGASRTAIEGKFALARYKTNGALDTSFGGDGTVTTNLAAGEEVANDVAIQEDGKIVAGGYTDVGDFAVVRYNADGTLDTSFDGDGKVIASVTSDFDWLFGVAIQADGKIVAVGSGGLNSVAVVRFAAEGTLDTTFDGDGIVTTDLTSGYDAAIAVAIQEDGKIIAAGEAGYDGEWTGSFGLVRYNADGTLDSTFGGDGKVITNFTNADDDVSDVVIQVDGKFVAVGRAGYQGPGSLTKFALARYNVDGTLDSTFGGNGKVITKITGYAFASAAAIQDDGKIIAAGSCHDANGKFALARYLGG